ncbi:MAG: hypothetical protein HC802_18525, partial [Caldilineaceae bacterium]|nr:hypothetical protein [Caldilineaceae bacterium]
MNPPPAVKGAALLALCALRTDEAVEAVLPYLNDPQPLVRHGALVGLLREGGIAGIVVAGERLTALTTAPDPAQRILGAKVLAAVGVRTFYQPLLALLADEELAVRQEALLAAQQVCHPRLLPALVAALDDPTMRSSAMAALVAGGELMQPLLTQALADKHVLAPATVRRLVRAGGQSRGAWVIAALQPYLDHPDGEVQQQVLLALQRSDYRAQGGEIVQVNAVLQACAPRRPASAYGAPKRSVTSRPLRLC